MYDTIANVQENNDVAIDARKNNYASCKFTMQLQVYTKKMSKNKLQKGVVKLKYVSTKEQVAYVLTKPLARIKFEYFRDKLGVVRNDLSRNREG